MTDFEKATHNAEIQATRVGGLGGSDADMMYRVGVNGLSALTNTDLKRLAVMTGQAEQVDWGGNKFTNAGHLFEDYIADTFKALTREKKLTAELAKNFATFAHADFINKKENVVVECKFVGETDVEKVAKRYYSQLQYYYLLGVKGVKLLVGNGDVEPFAVANVQVRDIDRDDDVIDAIINGIKLIDEFIPTFVYNDTTENATDLSSDLSVVLEAMLDAKSSIERYKAIYDEAASIIEAYMSENDVTTIDAGSHVVSLSKSTTARSFDAKSFLKEYPEYDVDMYYKTTARKGSFKVTERKNN